MANERIVLDGFRYELEEGRIWQEGQAAPVRVAKVIFHDDKRGVTVEAWFPWDAWEAFKTDANKGVFVPTRDSIERLGV